MKRYTADLHVHSVLSPCGDLEMSPKHIISVARQKKIDIIGITDHNSTRHCRVMSELGEKNGICVLPGTEINTKEEVHCLAFFENTDKANAFQEFLDSQLRIIPNDPDRFGDQVVVDEDENILEVIHPLLINSLAADLYQVADEVHRLGGLFIPAHIDRTCNSVLSQLGFLPGDLRVDALEVSSAVSCEEFLGRHPELGQYPLITSSDAHSVNQLGTAVMQFELEDCSFGEIKAALKGIGQRKVIRP